MVTLKIPRRKRDTHKGDYGRVLVIAGSAGMTGAAYLTSQAAMLSGAGLVTLAIPESLNDIMEIKLTEVITRPLPQTRERSLALKSKSLILKMAGKSDAVAIGPGLSLQSETVKLIQHLVGLIDQPCVVDADGLSALSQKLPLLKKRADKVTILTPHLGEMARLAGRPISYLKENKRREGRSFAKRHNVTLVLKGHPSMVVSPKGEIYINSTGNPGMATAGSGDVLTGVITSFVGQGWDPFKAACLGVKIHGLSGDMAVKEKGEASLIASDLLTFLPRALQQITRLSSFT